jgi:hypothetical protein
MTENREPLRSALKRMPVPPMRPDFAAEAIANAVRDAAPQTQRNVFARWETWMGAALGAAATVLVTIFLMRPGSPAIDSGITLALNEARTVEVLIDSERALEDATIRIAASGSVELDGLEDTREVRWQTRLDRGRNVLSLPIVARSAGTAELVATIEHEGRVRRVAVKMVVKSTPPKVA